MDMATLVWTPKVNRPGDYLLPRLPPRAGRRLFATAAAEYVQICICVRTFVYTFLHMYIHMDMATLVWTPKVNRPGDYLLPRLPPRAGRRVYATAAAECL